MVAARLLSSLVQNVVKVLTPAHCAPSAGFRTDLRAAFTHRPQEKAIVHPAVPVAQLSTKSPNLPIHRFETPP